MKRLLILTLLLLVSVMAKAQVAGMSTLAVLDMPTFGRSAGVGFDFLSLYDGDVTLTVNNPSLICDRPNDQLALGYVGMFSEHFASAAYSHSFGKAASFTFALQYAGYGKFAGYDEFDQSTGSFNASDMVLSVGWGMALDDRFSVGANFKPILSQYESYTAFALAFDLAGTFVSSNRRFAVTLMGRNIGTQLFTFDGTRERLPFELAAAGSYKLSEAPFRFHFALTELQRWNLRYEDPLNPSSTTDYFTGEVTTMSKAAQFFDNLGRHVNVGLEVDIKNTVFLRFGYCYRQMAEMKASNNFNTSGFSFGVGVKVKRFEFSYSRNNYHLSQAPNFVTVAVDMGRFFK